MNKEKLETKLMNKIKKQHGGQIPDERQQQFNSMVLTTAVTFGIVFDLIMMIYYFVTRNIEKAYPYVAQLVIMGVACLLASLGSREVQPPTILFTKRSVNIGKGAPAFFSRMAWCMLDSLIFAAVLTVCDIYADGKVTGSLVSDGLIMFCTFLVVDCILCEIKVRRYRKYMALLDAEENDLED